MNPSKSPGIASHGTDAPPEARELPQRNRRLEMVGRLTATVLHEIRNPLSVIKGYAELMARDGRTPEDARLQGLLKGVDRLDAVMNCVLAVVRKPADGQYRAEVGASIRLAQEFVTMAHRPKALVTVDIPNGLPPAKIAPTDLEQVLLNLLMNACDATDPHPMAMVKASFAPEGPPTPSWGPYMASTASSREWSAQWSSGKPAVLISVHDDGKGITPEVLRLLFNEQITTKQHNHGTGLGLLLCRDVLAAHGSTLVIGSSFGAGTAATVIVPAIATTVWTRDDAIRGPSVRRVPLIE